MVSFTIVIDPGRRVYVRRVAIAGNSKTRDEVVRREMRQLEGSYYDSSKIQLSRRRIDRTQYFSDVSVETQPVEGSPDQVDVVYTVKEKADGRPAGRRRLLDRGQAGSFDLDPADQCVRQRQVPVGGDQLRIGEQGSTRFPTSTLISPSTA